VLYQLKAILKRKDLVSTLLYAAKRCNDDVQIAHCFGVTQSLISQAQKALHGHKPDLQGFKILLHWFYRDMAFSGAKSQFFRSRYSLMHKIIETRTGIPALLAVFFCHIGERLGFDVGCVGFPGQFLIRWQAEEERAYFIEPSSGKFIDYNCLLQIYAKSSDRGEVNDIPQELFEVSDEEVTLVRVLHNLKSAYISEDDYSHALNVCDMLVALNPNDPYERRDRGFLLEQLECPHTASLDYQYFVEQCPEDPMIGVVEAQLSETRKVACIMH
jgi:regulator of sirC expression with transglutaminase-like and TPR domain